uniref:Uncharacterized protein n=1 Tax=Opuntia streptacantha TaxID=393608 RepID=A0A7C9D720_OPUST
MLAEIRLLTFVFSKRAKAGRALGVVVVACVDLEEVIVEMCAVVYWVGSFWDIVWGAYHHSGQDCSEFSTLLVVEGALYSIPTTRTSLSICLQIIGLAPTH